MDCGNPCVVYSWAGSITVKGEAAEQGDEAGEGPSPCRLALRAIFIESPFAAYRQWFGGGIMPGD